MEEKRIKKKKLTLSVTSKKRFESFNYTKGLKSTVVVEKKSSRKRREINVHGQKNNTNRNQRLDVTKVIQNKSFGPSISTSKKSFEIRKIAEQTATKRFKDGDKKDQLQKGKISNKSKGNIRKREYKLTISRALQGDEIETKERSLASVRRARLKEKTVTQNENKKFEIKKVIRDVNIPNKITIQELSNRMAEQASSIIKHLLGMGVKATINHTLDADTAEYLVKEFGHAPTREQNPDLQFSIPNIKKDKNFQIRPPIVTVMGHVNHGKTSLLDSFRKSNVASQEHGGITQHIGAYQVDVESGKSITFIDTPGHAAFTEMRARGSKITDIVVLVVAANDGVKPQTVEAIEHAKAAKVPIIVAINKCDLPQADPKKIKNQLLEYELIAEELSGETLFAEVSATTKKNLEKLKEYILLQADILDLKSNPNEKASGVILESRIDKGKGAVSTVLITNGSLKKGDFFVSGATWGKIRAMVNYEGNNLEIATPSTPVEILGMNGSAFSGDDFAVVDTEDRAKEINSYRLENIDSKKGPLISTTQDKIFDKEQKVKELSIIIKSDVHGSSEALKNAINKIKHEEVLPKIILSSIGLITETDVSLAKASNAIIIGFNVRPNKEAKKLAESYNLEIKFFNIIYEVLDFINSNLSDLLKPQTKEEVIGSAEILEIFKVSKIGKVAGSKVLDGEITNNSNARLIRNGVVLYAGSINSIFREKNATKQVTAGLECGITLKNFNDFKRNDVIEAYKVIEISRRL